MATLLYSKVALVNSRGYYSSNYYKYWFYVYLDSQDPVNNTSTIRMETYLGCNATSTSNRWSSSYYYAGFNEYVNGATSATQLTNNRHAAWANASGKARTTDLTSTVGQNLFESNTKTYTHDANGHLDLKIEFFGKRTSGSSTYVPVDVTYTSTALDIPDLGGYMSTKVSGDWKNGIAWIKVSGTWKKSKEVYYKVNGEWKKATQ